jgi:hypothetical protein
LVDPLGDATRYAIALALSYWVLVYGIEALMEREDRRNAPPDEVQRERRFLYVMWWGIAAVAGLLLVREIVGLVEAGAFG